MAYLSKSGSGGGGSIDGATMWGRGLREREERNYNRGGKRRRVSGIGWSREWGDRIWIFLKNKLNFTDREAVGKLFE